MALKIYKKTGLRRDKNLGDVSNPATALNNLLDSLKDDENSTFISEDLDAIRNISSLGLSNSEYVRIIGSEETYTDSNGISQPFLPRITYQNRLDRFKQFSGEPRLNGGGGLTAKYYAKEQVFENTTSIFSGSPFKIDNFWEDGYFMYSGKITPEANDVNGGVEWEGYFVPTVSSSYVFDINTSALFTFDFQTENYISGIGTYTEIVRTGLSSTFSCSGTANSNTITLTNLANVKHIGVGQSVSAIGIVAGTKISEYNRNNGVITLSPPAGSDYALSSDIINSNVIFYKTIGQDTRVYYKTYVLEAFKRYRIRFRYYIPQSIDANNVTRLIYFRFTRFDINLIDLRYTNLYDINYDFSDSGKGTFTTFLDNSIDFGGGLIGGSVSNDYVKIQTSKKVDILYQPKSSINEIIKSSVSGNISINSTTVSISDTSGIEIGNYVFGTGIPSNAIVKEIIINNSVILDKDATNSGTVDLTFIDHRGFVKSAIGSGSGGSFTLSSGNTTNLKSGMVMIGSGIQSYTVITTTGSSSSFTISPSQTISAGKVVYFYQSKGLINNALDSYCVPANTTCLIVSSLTASGSTVIPVNSTAGISNGWIVQGYQFSSNTKISSFTSNTITIDKGTTRSLIAGANFTVTNASGDRTLCCPPTDTSPPFNPTLQGLETVAASPSLRIDSGNIIFGALISDMLISNITDYNSNTDFSRSRLSIQTASGTYKILCS